MDRKVCMVFCEHVWFLSKWGIFLSNIHIFCSKSQRICCQNHRFVLKAQPFSTISHRYCSEFGQNLKYMSRNCNRVDTNREDLGQNLKHFGYNLKYCGQNQNYFRQNRQDVGPNIKYFCAILNDFDSHQKDFRWNPNDLVPNIKEVWSNHKDIGSNLHNVCLNLEEFAQHLEDFGFNLKDFTLDYELFAHILQLCTWKFLKSQKSMRFWPKFVTFWLIFSRLGRKSLKTQRFRSIYLKFER